MNIQLSEERERQVRSLIQAGRYGSTDELFEDALRLLDRHQSGQKSLSRADFDQYLLDCGLLSQVPETAADFDDPDDQPIEIRGEPLSETVIRDRR